MMGMKNKFEIPGLLSMFLIFFLLSLKSGNTIVVEENLSVCTCSTCQRVGPNSETIQWPIKLDWWKRICQCVHMLYMPTSILSVNKTSGGEYPLVNFSNGFSVHKTSVCTHALHANYLDQMLN